MEKPTLSNIIVSAIFFGLCALWMLAEYRKSPSDFPYEPCIAAGTYLVAFLGYLTWKKQKEETVQQPTTVVPAADLKEIIDTIKRKDAIAPEYRNYGDRRIPHHLTPPPIRSETFLGRQGDLDAIEKHFFHKSGQLLLLNGEGGVGKTTLAARYYHQQADRYAHLAWVLCERKLADSLLTALARPLGLDFPPEMPTPERLPLLMAAPAHGCPCRADCPLPARH